MPGYRMISSDSHVFEPKDLWTSRLEAKYPDRAPRIVRREEDGTDWWVCDGLRGVGGGSGAMTGLRFEEPERLSLAASFEDVRPGGYIPEEHIKDMDTDGVEVGILYATAALLLYSVPDSDFLSAIFGAYNDWLAEFCQPYASRTKGIAMLNIDDVQSGVKEMQRCAKMGLAGAMITVYPPTDRTYESPEYEPLWAAAQDLGMPLSLHVGTNRSPGGMGFVDLEAPAAAAFTNLDHWVRMSLAHIIFSGVFEPYPKLRVGAVEHESSWVPHFLERMDYNYTQRPPSAIAQRYKENMLPSDYFHRNCFVGFQEDAIGIRNRDLIGVDNLMWGSDYPHAESTFPRSRQILEEILADCTDEEKAKIAGGNCARI